MSDLFYKTIYTGTSIALFTSSRALVRGLEHVPTAGGAILAPNHFSWYDIPLLAYHTPRMLDFVATDELFRRPFWNSFYRGMNCIRHQRDAPDPRAVRMILGRLQKGRVVTIFPEGKLCAYEHSLFTDGVLRPGMARLAMRARVPLIPVVLLNTDTYRRFRSWIPFFRARYGVIYGEPLAVPHVASREEQGETLRTFEEAYRTRMRTLREVLLGEMQAIGWM